MHFFLKVDSRIQWGGKFNFKIDAMHFGFKYREAKNIINQN